MEAAAKDAVAADRGEALKADAPTSVAALPGIFLEAAAPAPTEPPPTELLEEREEEEDDKDEMGALLKAAPPAAGVLTANRERLMVLESMALPPDLFMALMVMKEQLKLDRSIMRKGERSNTVWFKSL